MYSCCFAVFTCLSNHLVLVVDLSISQEEHSSLFVSDIKISDFLKRVKDVCAAKVCLEVTDLRKDLCHNVVVVSPNDTRVISSFPLLLRGLIANKVTLASKTQYSKCATTWQTLNKEFERFLCDFHSAA